MRRIAWIVAAAVLYWSLSDSWAEHQGGAIVTGLDTLHMSVEKGFDFVRQAKCTLDLYTPPYDCYNHIRINYVHVPPSYSLISPFGFGLQMGKTNLDSIDAAPSDSVFESDGHEVHVDSIPPDSLQHAVGNSYIIKSGIDPRYNWRHYAKIRILAFDVIDSANHVVDMVFLWAYNGFPNRRDLTTTDLDTFSFGPTHTAGGAPVVAATPRPRAPVARTVATVRSGVRVVRERGVGERVEVFDLRGRAVMPNGEPERLPVNR